MDTALNIIYLLLALFGINVIIQMYLVLYNDFTIHGIRPSNVVGVLWTTIISIAIGFTYVNIIQRL